MCVNLFSRFEFNDLIKTELNPLLKNLYCLDVALFRWLMYNDFDKSARMKL